MYKIIHKSLTRSIKYIYNSYLYCIFKLESLTGINFVLQKPVSVDISGIFEI